MPKKDDIHTADTEIRTPKTPLILTFANYKGGVAKSSSAVFFAQVLYEAGYRVRVIDADPQGSAYDWWEDAASMDDPLPFEVSRMASRTLHRQRDTLTGRGVFEVVIIDCPPESQQGVGGDAGQIVKSAVRAADIVVTPFQPAMLDVKRLWPFAQTVQTAREDEGRVIVHVLAMCKVDRRTNHGAIYRQTVEAVEDAPPVCSVDIPLRGGFAYVGGSSLDGDPELVELYRGLVVEVFQLASDVFELVEEQAVAGRNVVSMASAREAR